MMSEPISDTSLDADVEAWLSAARAGSPEALGNLWQAFGQYLALIAHHGISGELRSKIGSSDLLQETFLEAQRDFANFRGETRAQLQAWLRQLLLNNLLNVRRSFRETQMRAVGREQPLPGSRESDGWHPAGDDTSPSDRAIRQEEAVRLERALAELPEHYRLVIELRNHQHLSFVEIGARMNRSEDGVRMLWARAFERLAQALEELS
jgi:RNA polymerase sigma-70 factor (ECF subfamily)